jgi:hypothetical protein
MTQLEDQLRSAFRAKAGEITPPPPPLELQPRPVPDAAAHRGNGGLGTRPQRRWIVPLAAAVAVVAILAVALIAGRALPIAPPAASIRASVPRYYVALQTMRPAAQPATAASVATVRNTATGAMLATVRPPAPFTGFSFVSGTADDRTFMLLAHGAVRPHGNVWKRFYLLHIDPSAATAAGRTRLTRLPVHGDGPLPVQSDWQVDAMALAPDGRSLATVQTNVVGQDLIFVYNSNPETAGEGSWAGRICPHTTPGAPDAGQSCSVTLSWIPAGARIGFVPGAGGKWHMVQLTPEGMSALISYRESGRVVLNRLAGNHLVTLARIDPPAHVAGNRNRYEILRTLTARGVLWASSNGRVFIVSGARPGQTAGIYRGNRYTPLPWPTNVIDAAW